MFFITFQIFIELDELNYADRTWRETTRWMKYEEHVLPNGNWSRPQVPFVQYEGFLALKDYLLSGTCSPIVASFLSLSGYL